MTDWFSQIPTFFLRICQLGFYHSSIVEDYAKDQSYRFSASYLVFFLSAMCARVALRSMCVTSSLCAHTVF